MKSYFVLLLVLLIALASSIPAIGVLLGNDFSISFQGGSSLDTILLEIDPLSAWFILIINLTLINGAIYGTGYMSIYKQRKNDLILHWTMFVLFQVSMILVCMLRNGFAFLIAWEIMTLSSLILVLFDHHKANTMKAGLNYLVQMHLGVAFLTIAFIWVFAYSHSFGFDSIGIYLNNKNTAWVIVLFFLGFGIKAGFVPLHTWLPYAHPAAPSHVSGVMSGVIVKIGIYGILRIAILIHNNMLTLGIVLLLISAITTLYGILNASVHRDFKKMLAYCTTENIGIIGMGIGVALVGKGIGNPIMIILGYSAALLHTLNHSLFKSLLFFSAGNIYLKTHTRNMEYLGGLIRYMPHTALIFLTGALAIGGLPPFNGFVSKFMVYSGFIEAFKFQNVGLSALMILCVTILSMAGGISMLTFTKAFGTIFLGVPRVAHKQPPEEVSFLILLPLYFIILIMLIIGIFPQMVLMPIFSIIQSFEAGVPTVPEPYIRETLTWTGRTSLLLVAVIILLLMVRKGITRRKSREISPTWGCGYVAPSPVMQYTGKSFSKSLAKLFGFITMENKKYLELKQTSVFPGPRSYASYYLEFFETRIIDPAIRQFLILFNFFSFIHNGKIQFYVLYGFFFVLLLIILSFINIL
jgi:hydrogenase-4 component B